MAVENPRALATQGPSWDRLQSVWLLPAARRIYIVGSFAAVGVALLAILAALVFHLLSTVTAPQHNVPEEKRVEVAPFAPANADALVTPPSNVRVITQRLVAPVRPGDVIGRFRADSSNHLVSFDIVGGLSAELVSQQTEFLPVPGNPAAATTVRGGELRVTAEMARRLAGVDPDAPQDPLIALRVFATDTAGNASPPRNLNFRLAYVAPGPAAAQLQPSGENQDQIEDISGSPALRPTAGLLARRAAEPGTPEYFEAYQRAMQLPAQCDADGNDTFIKAYVAAAARAAPRIHSQNFGSFLGGLCDLWDAQITQAATVEREANAARAAIIARNADAEMRSLEGRAEAVRSRNTAFTVAGSAIAFFMVIALFLAFMAIEGHSKALRDALQAIARERGHDA